MLTEIRVLAATGMVGSGFSEDSLRTAMARNPQFIGCDAGSIDPGPYYLGSGQMMFGRAACKRDLGLMLQAARRARIPLVIGSAGTAGGDPHVSTFADIVRELAVESGLHFRLGVIRSEQDKTYVKGRLAAGRVRPLANAPDYSAEIVDRSVRIVGMMGVEPIQHAIDDGADVVIAGRATDTSIFAAIPLMRGMPAGPVWHAAKILECGTAATAQRTRPDCMFATIHHDHFDLDPPAEIARCTPLSVAAHSLYENDDPTLIVEPSGVLDTSEASYEALDARRVRVSGSRFHPAARYSIKLEGAELAGYQSIVIGAVRDPVIIRDLDAWLETTLERIRSRLVEIHSGVSEAGPGHLSAGSFSLGVRVYGRDGAIGSTEPERSNPGHEVCLIFELTAPTRQLADDMARSAAHIALHSPVSEWEGIITTMAMPYSPLEIPRGPVYRFNVNHVVEPDTAMEMFRYEREEL